MTKTLYVDSHCHLQDKTFKDDLEDIITDAQETGIGAFLIPGTDIDDSKAAIRIADQYPDVYAAAGVHPHDAAKVPPGWIQEIRKLAGHKKVVAIGEVGLDFYYNFSPRDKQAEVFKQQVELALELKLPLVIHMRNSIEETFDILDKIGGWAAGGIFHCFPGFLADAKLVISKGFHISYTGIITFKKSEKAREVVRNIPIEKLLLETDSPYMAPEPHRGKRNIPGFIKYIAETIADIKGLKPEEVGEITTSNFKTLFRLDIV